MTVKQVDSFALFSPKLMTLLTLISYLCQVPDVCEGGGTEGLHQVTAPQITSRDPS
jgi:hypothetical protein